MADSSSFDPEEMVAESQVSVSRIGVCAAASKLGSVLVVLFRV